MIDCENWKKAYAAGFGEMYVPVEVSLDAIERQTDKPQAGAWE
jgi:hypothetical protein